jgi:hypothetical protein
MVIIMVWDLLLYVGPEQGVKLLGLLLTWSAGPQPLANRNGHCWPDIHWLARDKGGLVAAVFEA